VEFLLKVTIDASSGETEDEVYHWLCNKLHEIDGVTDVEEIQQE
jgi:hypothetical protein